MSNNITRRLLTLSACSTVVALYCCTVCLADQPSAQLSSYDEFVLPLVERMTLEEKVGQMTQAELGSLEELDDIERLFLGSVLSGGNSDPEDGNSLTAWTDTFDACQSQALKTRLAIPLLYGVDAVHGHNNVLDAVIFPHNIGLGCTRNPDLVEQIGRLTAIDVRATGIQWAFAPCLTVPRDDRWGRTYEGFSEDPSIVATLGAAAVRGLQGDSLDSPNRVLACAKHFAGDGGTTADLRRQEVGTNSVRLDQGDVHCDESTFRRLHIFPYIQAIDEGVASIMPSYSSWNGVKCTGNRRLLTEILKEEMGFEGFVVSDFGAIDQVHEDYRTAIKICVNAGIDMAMVPGRHREFHSLLCGLVRDGDVSTERINDAVTRVLRVKAAMGLLDRKRKHLADRRLHKCFSTDEHVQVARQSVRESLVLLKNDDATLPLSSKLPRLHVCGPAANDLARQCGGWTIGWQGLGDIDQPRGVTILDAIKRAASPNQEVVFSPDGDDLGSNDVALVVVAEPPYAEWFGDRKCPQLPESDRRIVSRVADSGATYILLVLCGRPLDLGESIDSAGAIVVAWLPGTAGDGIADVLFGNYAPTGKLSFSWPKLGDQQPLNIGDSDYEPLFPFDHGLTY